MSGAGYVLLHRSMMDSYLWDLPDDQLRIALACIQLANWKPGTAFSGGRRVDIPRGTFMTSVEKLAARASRRTGKKRITVRTVRTALKNLERAGFLTSKTTNRYSLISVVNYERYQSPDCEIDKQLDMPATSDRQASDKPATTIEEREQGKKENKGKKHTPPMEAVDLALLLATRILERDPDSAHAKKAKAKPHSWADDIRKLHELDGRPWEAIRDVLEWSQKSAFWQANILSGAKLRKQFDTLNQQRSRDGGGSRFGHYKHDGTEHYAGGEVRFDEVSGG